MTFVAGVVSIWSHLGVCLTFVWPPKLVWFLKPYETFKINSFSLKKLRPIPGPLAQSCGELPPREAPECPPTQGLCHFSHLEAPLHRCLHRLPGSRRPIPHQGPSHWVLGKGLVLTARASECVPWWEGGLPTHW